jgi:hypothetical protein
MGIREPFTELAQLSSASVDALERATAIFRKQKIGWKNYKVSVLESDYSFLVEFWQPEHEITIHPDAIMRNGRLITKGDVPGGDLISTRPSESFRVTLDKKTWRATWNSLEGDKF